MSQMHEDFSPVLQVLYHVLAFQSSEFDADHCSTQQYIDHMDELDYMVEDLCRLLLEYSASTSLNLVAISTRRPQACPSIRATSHGFLTEQEAESAMIVAQQQDLFQQHVAALAP